MKMNNSIEEWERRVALLAILPWEKKLEELRYNPYHDPNNGRFTSGNYSGKTFMPDIRKRYSDGGAKHVDKSMENDIIKINDEFQRHINGTSAANGVTVKNISYHAAERMIQRNVSLTNVKDALEKPYVTYRSKTDGSCTVFDRGRTHVVLSDSGKIITVAVNG